MDVHLSLDIKLCLQETMPAGLHRIVDHEAGTFKYFLKIVPTVYKPLAGILTTSLLKGADSMHKDIFMQL